MLVDDYDSWEQGVSAEDLKQVLEGSQNHSGMIYCAYSHYQTFLQFVLDSQNIFDAGGEDHSTEKMDGKSGIPST
jgi:hypothetical protein